MLVVLRVDDEEPRHKPFGSVKIWKILKLVSEKNGKDLPAGDITGDSRRTGGAANAPPSIPAYAWGGSGSSPPRSRRYAPRTPTRRQIHGVFQVIAEHPREPRVADDMEPAAMQEHVGEQGQERGMALQFTAQVIAQRNDGSGRHVAQ